MSKKLKSLMVIAAAGLLSLPTQAQNRVPVKATPNAGNTIQTPASRLNFSNLSKENVLIKAIEAGITDKTELEKIWNSNISTPARRNNIRKANKVDTLPYFNDILTEEKFNEFTVLDVNNDEKTWTYMEFDKCAAYKYHSTNTGDDWLITPGIKLEAGKSYDFLVDLKAGITSYPEKYEIKMVKSDKTPTAEAISAGTVLVPTTVLSEGNFATYGKEGFFVDETAYYYIGIHALTEPDHFYLYAKNVNVREGNLTSNAPAAPELKVTAAPMGQLKASVEVTAPTKTITGEDIGNNLSKIELFRDNELVNTFNDVTKGQVLTFEDTENLTHATHTYYAVPFDAAGKESTKSDAVAVYIGFDKPALPLTMSGKDLLGKVSFTWNLVNTGVKNGYLDPTTINYNVYTAAVETMYGYSYLVLKDKIGTVTNKDNYEYSGINPDEGEQDYTYFAVQTQNEAGTNDAFTSCYILMGKPYDLPIIEGMKNRKFTTFWFNDEIVSELGVSTESTDGDGFSLDFKKNPDAKANEGFLSSGKLNLNDPTNPTLIFDAKRGSANSNLAIYASKDGGEQVKVSDIELTDEFQTFKVDLKDFKGSRYAQVRFVSYFAANADNIIIDNIMIRDYYTDDLGIKMNAPASVMASGKAAVEVTVENNGANTCDNYTVDFYAGEKKIKSETVTEPLKPFEKKTFNFEYETTIFDEGDVTLKAVVTAATDIKPENNTEESVINIRQSKVASPTNLNATEGEGGVTLTWSAPENIAAEVTETFDDEIDFPPFSIGGITKDVHFGKINEWSVYDSTGIGVFFFQGLSYPNTAAVQAWQVFNPDAVSPNWDNMTPRSGKQYMISLCSANGDEAPKTDHWLISPKLPGKAQTIDFYGKQVSTTDQTKYGYFWGFEKFEVYSSKSATADEIPAFTKLGDGQISKDEWDKFSFDLPEGSTYFAIRHTSENVFGLMVDDVTYTAGAGGEVVSYNIYVDGELYANVDASKLTALIGILENGSHTFAVTAVYSNGKESRPVTFVLGTTSIDAVSVDGKPVDIYTIDGKLVRKQATNLEGLRGMYIINNRKIVIR
ncbi:MAG: choice-of-anchor J domain-containing protein [Prevotella sp.]|uniref:choice-of-anchor J domain-containing protein n=1 Tax=Prevotella sp. TaxID=59823 RepID=UPI002A33B701|nr:choice-of-anchor J domain-containing protein [Prevotella sp.]MDD7317812.1 choice-of-anchor J domain-containing protein [Prevotellaceae bacterium]MDY4020727.1 choice-of-anchor J domain-containing protein [Prevotella sp.]